MKEKNVKRFVFGLILVLLLRGTVDIVSAVLVDFAQHSARTTGDFVFLTDDGKVYEVDPRHLSSPEFRTADGPSNIVAMKPNTYDNSILAVTSDGVLYRATTDDDWNTWIQVGTIAEYPPTTAPTPAITPTPITPTPTPVTPTPSQLDSDGDGWSDEKEREMGTNPHSVDSDNDGINDPQDPNPTVPEKKVPGFEAVFAIIGLLAVAYLLRRR